ncbi:hypothetical protein GIB67_007907 [Kingdonia uniflora]|uniref:AAA+ ATPase domain-containing protein n=1 Tax=Kingdonia uniflora TaxID=39325 RepID=A0A7J7PBL4_9MAGN|nr:hypothetical protein GIB67_007907 [Kingdonia uniflora]
MDSLVVVGTEIVKGSFDPIGRQASYIFRYKRNISNLKKKAEDLQRIRNDVEQLVLTAQMRGEIIHLVVREWLIKVDKVIGQTTKLIVEAEMINSFSKGWSGARYRLGKEGYKKISVVSELVNEGISLSHFSYPAPPPGIESTPTGDFWTSESIKLTIHETLEALKDEKIDLVGVYGMGGVGKTTLMKQIAKQVKQDMLFHEVVMATISQNVNVKTIQEELAENLGLKLDEQSVSVRARRLLMRLKQEKSILIILDNIWTRLDLAEVGILQGEGCKIVFTTRRQNVCSLMGTQKTIKVELLSEQDSWNLFRQKAGDVVDSPDLLEVAKEVASESKGLPLAIVTLGRALRDKDQDVWVDVARQLKKSIFTDIEGMHPTVFSSIKLSYDYLVSEQTQNCFLFCCLFPEDYRISKNELLMYVMGERLLGDVDTLEEARGRLHTIIEKLTSSCLLLKGDKDGYIKMHDIVRDVAISIASEERTRFVTKAGLGLHKWPEMELGKCMRMSLMGNRIRILPNNPFCPQILTLSLAENNRSLIEFPDGFFQFMESLVTLDLNHMVIRSLPPSLSCLINLRSLSLDHCERLTEKAVSLIGNLEKLEMLSLIGCRIRKLPKEMRRLTNLRLLDLSYSCHLETIPANVISSLSCLEELNMNGSGFSAWETANDGVGDDRSASLAELASLTMLTTLCLRVSNIECLSKELYIDGENLKKFAICIGQNVKTNLISSTRSMCLSPSLDPVAKWVKVLLDKTEELCLQGHQYRMGLDLVRHNNLKSLSICYCDALTLLTSDLLVTLPNLENFNVDHCEEAKEVFNSDELEEGYAPLSRLRKITLGYLRNLRTIWKGVVPFGSLIVLREMNVLHCDSLKFLFSQAMAKCLQQMEELIIVNCKGLVEIINLEKETEKALGTSSSSNSQTISLVSNSFSHSLTVFPRLRVLSITGCEKLKYLFSTRVIGSLVQLEELYIFNCNHLEELVEDYEFRSLTDTRVSVFPIFRSLRKLKLAHCESMEYLFPVKMAVSLLQLQVLQIQSCPKMKSIFSVDTAGYKKALKLADYEEFMKYGRTENKMLPLELRNLELKDLPNLMDFCLVQKCYLIVPFLEKLTIVKCPNLKTLNRIDLDGALQLKKITGDGTQSLPWFVSNLTVKCPILKKLNGAVKLGMITGDNTQSLPLLDHNLSLIFHEYDYANDLD